MLTLLQTHPSGDIPTEWQAQYWARTARGSSIDWTNLPMGEYDVYAQPSDSKAFVSAVHLSTITLGSRVSTLNVSLPPTPRTEGTSTLSLQAATTEQLNDLVMSATGARGEPSAVPHALEEASEGVLVHVRAARTVAPFFGKTHESFVASLASPTGKSSEVIDGVVTDLAHAGMHVQSGDPQLPIPRTGIMSFRKCNDGSATIDFPVAVAKDGGTLTFDAPANCTEVVAKFSSFGPLSIARSLRPLQAAWLGEFKLYPGGRVAARVVDDNEQPVTDATISIYNTVNIDRPGRTPLVDRIVGSHGWAYFDDLPSNRDLTVIATTLAHARSAPTRFRVRPASEVIINPIRVDRPATLTVRAQLDVTFREKFPKGYIDTIFVSPEIPSAPEEQQRQHLNEDHQIIFKGLRPGWWRTTALISTGKGLQPVTGERVQLKAGANVQLDAVFKPLVFTGRVTLRGVPVHGNLDIHGSHLTDVIPSVPISSDGEFQAILPRADTYMVDVRRSAPMSISWVGGIAFTEPADPVDIALPVGAISVEVRRGGSPAAHVLDSAKQHLDSASGMQMIETFDVRTDANGATLLDSVLPGVWIITAEDPDRGLTATSAVNVGVDIAHISLTLGESAPLRGTVREAIGAPVAGAMVRCVIPSPDGIAQVLSTTTADDGTFRFETTADGVSARCGVLSSIGTQAYRVIMRQDSDLVISQPSAELLVSSLPAVTRVTSLWLVATDGRLLDATPFVRTAGATVTLMIPSLAPDTYRLVRVESLRDWVALTTGGGTVPTLAEFTLRPGEKHHVDVH